LGWIDVPLMCGYEMNVDGALMKCIRVLVHWNTEKPQDEIRHVYLREARALRPDKSIVLSDRDLVELESWIEEHLVGVA